MGACACCASDLRALPAKLDVLEKRMEATDEASATSERMFSECFLLSRCVGRSASGRARCHSLADSRLRRSRRWTSAAAAIPVRRRPYRRD